MASDEDNPIFIFASGQRCGSTLLQRYLCSHPDILLWGEHNGFLEQMREEFRHLHLWEKQYRHQRTEFLAGGPNYFIANMSPPRETLIEAQSILLKALWAKPAYALGHVIWGFKEVRYGADMAAYLLRLFPSARIIHLTRNITDCFISLQHWERGGGWTRQDTLKFIENWVRINRSFLSRLSIPDDQIFTLTYEQLTKSTVETTMRLAHWLNLRHESLNLDVFANKIYTERHTGADYRQKITRSSLPMQDLALLNTDEIRQLSHRFGVGCSL